jgi:predicted cobalt transporter CbtA
MVLIIAFVLWSGITGHIAVYSWLAVAVVCGEGLVLLAFRGSCPLTIWARKYSDSTKHNFDIFLPEWLARYNKQIFTTVFVFGLVLMLVRYIGR